MMSESKMVEFFSILSALAGAILCFAGENEKSKGFGIVLLILAVLCIIIIAPIFRAKEMPSTAFAILWRGPVSVSRTLNPIQ